MQEGYQKADSRNLPRVDVQMFDFLSNNANLNQAQSSSVKVMRLVSERTIEENILKKANQKRLLGDLAIEGGNFTTAYFKSSTIQELFSIDANEESAANRMSEVVECSREREKLASGETPSSSRMSTPPPPSTGDDKTKLGALENAFTACEDDQDVQAARTAKAEAVADLAEFDENIPLEDADKEPEMSKAEQEIDNVIKKLTPVERYAMKFIEETESAWSAEQLAAAEREIEEQKREWEQNRLAAMREEEERRARELEEDNELLTFSREDATNQIWVSENTVEQMPMWCPPTPPQQETDVYIDHTMAFLYDVDVMSESQLPPIYIKKDLKRSRLEAGLLESRRALKIPRKEETMNAPKSIFHSPHILKMRRDMKLQKFRGMMTRPVPMVGKPSVTKPPVEVPPTHEWTIHEDMALLKVVQAFQGLPANLITFSPGHTSNWDLVGDYVNTASVSYRSPKQCRYRYESVLMQREEGKQIFDSSLRKKKKASMVGSSSSGGLQKYPYPQKSSRPMRTSQLYTQDNNSTYSQIVNLRYDYLKNASSKRAPTSRPAVVNASLKNPKHTAVLNDCGIDIDHPILPVDIATRRAERLAREKKAMTPEQQLAAARMHMMKISSQAQAIATSTVSQVVASSSPIPVVATAASQVAVTQTSTVVTNVATTVVTTPSTPPNALRTSRIIGSPIQTSTVVSVSGLSPAQLQAATQRLIVSSTPGQPKTVVGTVGSIQGKTINQAQLQMIRQATLKQHLRLQPGTVQQGTKNSTVTIGGQQAVVQFTQAQPRPQFIRQGTVTVGKTGITRTVSDEVAQLIKKQQQFQQQKAIAAAAASGTQATSIQSISPQVFAQAIQTGSSGTQVATLVKAVSSAGGSQTVSIPVTGVTLATPASKAVTSTLKTSASPQMRQFQLQQQLLAQKKLGGQKLSIAQVGGKNNIQTQLIVGPKPLSTAMTVQQFQQVIRSPLMGQTPVVLAKSASRVIPVNTAQGTKQTIQVVAATSQALNTTLRPQGTSTLAGALSGIKVPATSHVQQALLSQVSVALQNQNVGVRQGSPVRLQTSSGTPVVAVSVQSASNVQQGASSSTSNSTEQVSRFLKK